MIEISEHAAASLHAALTNEDVETGTAYRLVPLDDGAIGLDKSVPQSGDLALEHEGVSVLYVSESIAPILDDSRIEVHETEDGQKLRIVREQS